MKIETVRNKALDSYKGVFIILVVVRHVLQNAVLDEGGGLTNFIWAVQMPGFMLVSGYFSARKIEKVSEVWHRIRLSTQHYALPFFFLVCADSGVAVRRARSRTAIGS